jgi:hypothetical protein
MAAAVAVPKHKLSESPDSRAIEIFDWTVTAQTGPISNAAHCDALHAALGIPLPEMTFGANSLCITHRPTGWTYAFRPEDALKGVKNGPLEEGDGGVKVGYADAWLKSRCASRPSNIDFWASLCLVPAPAVRACTVLASAFLVLVSLLRISLFSFIPTHTFTLQDRCRLSDPSAANDRYEAVRLDVYDDIRREPR